MRDILTSLFGTYTPLLDPVSGSVVSGMAGVDWEWIAGVFLFGLVLLSLFKIINSLIRGV